jgi:hypothetical protein
VLLYRGNFTFLQTPWNKKPKAAVEEIVIIIGTEVGMGQ